MNSLGSKATNVARSLFHDVMPVPVRTSSTQGPLKGNE
jgi:hypothetical protein